LQRLGKHLYTSANLLPTSDYIDKSKNSINVLHCSAVRQPLKFENTRRLESSKDIQRKSHLKHPALCEDRNRMKKDGTIMTWWSIISHHVQRRGRSRAAGGEAPAACRYASTDGSNSAGLQVDDDEEDNPMEHLELAAFCDMVSFV